MGVPVICGTSDLHLLIILESLEGVQVQGRKGAPNHEQNAALWKVTADWSLEIPALLTLFSAMLTTSCPSARPSSCFRDGGGNVAVSMAVVDTTYCGEKTLFCYYTFIGSWFSTIFMLYKKNYGEKYLQNAPQISQSVSLVCCGNRKGFFFFFFYSWPTWRVLG